MSHCSSLLRECRPHSTLGFDGLSCPDPKTRFLRTGLGTHRRSRFDQPPRRHSQLNILRDIHTTRIHKGRCVHRDCHNNRLPCIFHELQLFRSSGHSMLQKARPTRKSHPKRRSLRTNQMGPEDPRSNRHRRVHKLLWHSLRNQTRRHQKWSGPRIWKPILAICTNRNPQ